MTCSTLARTLRATDHGREAYDYALDYVIAHYSTAAARRAIGMQDYRVQRRTYQGMTRRYRVVFTRGLLPTAWVTADALTGLMADHGGALELVVMEGLTAYFEVTAELEGVGI